MLREIIKPQVREVDHATPAVEAGRLYSVPLKRTSRVGKVLRPLIAAGLLFSAYSFMSGFEKYENTKAASINAISTDAFSTAVGKLENAERELKSEGSLMANTSLEVAVGALSLWGLNRRRKKQQYFNSLEVNTMLTHSKTNGDRVYRTGDNDKSKVVPLNSQTTSWREYGLSRVVVGASAIVLAGSLASMVANTSEAKSVARSIDSIEPPIPSWIVSPADSGYTKTLETKFYNKFGNDLGMTRGEFDHTAQLEAAGEVPSFNVATNILWGISDVGGWVAPQNWFGENSGHSNKPNLPYGLLDILPAAILGGDALNRHRKSIMVTQDLMTSSGNAALLAA